jgi:hypothetical protein
VAKIKQGIARVSYFVCSERWQQKGANPLFPESRLDPTDVGAIDAGDMETS